MKVGQRVLTPIPGVVTGGIKGINFSILFDGFRG